MENRFYREFEEKFRGTRNLIIKRLEVYLPFVEPLHFAYPEALMIDLGCGRGEWLELINQKKMKGIGVDLDIGMLEACEEKNLNTIHQDALEYLGHLEDESVSVITAFHIVEHLSFDKIKELVSESKRVLKAGGLLIMETPNPENFMVATLHFYLDPTHIRPIPPDLLSFVPEFFGFETIKVLRLQESEGLKTSISLKLRDILTGTSPDYSVIAQKTAPPELKSEMEDLLSAEFGISTDYLLDRHQAQENKFHSEIHTAIAEIKLSISNSLEELKEKAHQQEIENTQLKTRLLDKQSRIDVLLDQPWQKWAGFWSHHKLQLKEFYIRYLLKIKALVNFNKSKIYHSKINDLSKSALVSRLISAGGEYSSLQSDNSFVFVSSRSSLFRSDVLNKQILSKAKIFQPDDLIDEIIHANGNILSKPIVPNLFIPAEDDRLLTQSGQKKDGLIIVENASSGHALYGPYIDLAAGSYCVRIILSSHHVNKGSVWIDVVSSLASIQHAGKKFVLSKLPKGAGEIVLEIHSPVTIEGFEVRIFCLQRVEMAIYGLEVSATTNNTLAN